MNLVFSPFLPVEWIWALGLAGLALVLPGLLLRARGSLLRLLMLGLLVAALCNPLMRREERQPLNDIAVLVIDNSASQQLGDRQAQARLAEDAITKAVGTLPATELRIVTVTSGDGEDGTRAFAALDQALAAIPPERFAGAVLVTDGQVHDVPERFAARGYAGPVHVLLTGHKTERDRRIVIDEAPRFGLVGSPSTIRFHVEETGNASAGPIRVRVLLGEGESSTLTVAPGEKAEITAPITHAGKNFVELEAEALPGELTLANNKAAVITEGIRDRLRVLLVSGEPHPGERTWRNFLKSDPSVDLVHFTILRPPEKQDGTPINELSLIAFPTRELFVDKLDEFDLVVFDRYERRGIISASYLANVAGFVERGGAVLVASGPDYASPFGLYHTPLASVLPAQPTGEVTEQPFRPEVTDIGKRHPVTAALPGTQGPEPAWGRWFRQADVGPDTQGSTVLSGADGKPLLLLSRKGEGRVALMLSDHVWLWARGYEGGGPHAELLRRLAHWLMKEPDLEEEALVAVQEGASLVITRRTLAEMAEPVTVTSPSGKSQQVNLAETAPGRFSAKIPAAESGIWRLAGGGLEARAIVGEPDVLELRDISATAGKLSPIAGQTGGGVIWLEESPAPRLAKVAAGRRMAGSGWIGLKSNEAYRTSAITEWPLLSGLAGLGLLLGLISLVWRREGR